MVYCSWRGPINTLWKKTICYGTKLPWHCVIERAYSYVVYMYTSCEAKTSMGSLWMVLLHNYCNGLRLKIVPEGIIQGQSTGFFLESSITVNDLLLDKNLHIHKLAKIWLYLKKYMYNHKCCYYRYISAAALNSCWLRKLYTWYITMFEFTCQIMKCCGV